MATETPSPRPIFPPGDWTVADLLSHIDVPPERIRVQPAPGTATEADVQSIADREGRHFELVDGILIEKTMGAYESILAVLIAHFIQDYLETNNLGLVLGADGAMRILSRQVRIPDVTFVSWQRRGRDKLAKIPKLVPNLAVEVLSEGNTDAEMDRKLREYFEAGVELVWYVYPETRTAHVCTSLASLNLIGENGFLDGGQVLPGLQISLRDLFARADGPQP